MHSFNFFTTIIIILSSVEFCWTKIQYLENGPNYIRICCEFVIIEAYEITYDDKSDNVHLLQTLNATHLSNITSDSFVFSNIHKGYIVPLIPRYGFQLYKWYVLCLYTEMTEDCIFVRPCDCNCNNKAWLKITVTLNALPFPSDQLNITITPDFDTTSYPLPILPSFDWFASDWNSIMKCKSGETPPENCNFMVSGITKVYTYKTSSANITLNLHLNTSKVYFSLVVHLNPRWTNQLPTVGEQSLDPLIFELDKNQTTYLSKQYIVSQVSEDKLSSGRSPMSSNDRIRQCTDIGTIAMSDALNQNGGNNRGHKKSISTLFVILLIIFVQKLFSLDV